MCCAVSDTFSFLLGYKIICTAISATSYHQNLRIVRTTCNRTHIRKLHLCFAFSHCRCMTDGKCKYCMPICRYSQIMIHGNGTTATFFVYYYHICAKRTASAQHHHSSGHICTTAVAGMGDYFNRFTWKFLGNNSTRCDHGCCR